MGRSVPSTLQVSQNHGSASEKGAINVDRRQIIADPITPNRGLRYQVSTKGMHKKDTKRVKDKPYQASTYRSRKRVGSSPNSVNPASAQ